jgi:hypothetical protein
MYVQNGKKVNDSECVFKVPSELKWQVNEISRLTTIDE